MTNKRLFSLAIFAVAFAYIEADAVVYLRHLYYPGITSLFPLRSMDKEIFSFEVYREITTIVILAVVAYISSKKLWKILFLFLFLFGIWDIFYYIFLYLMIYWPPGLFSFDVLFLIPILWMAPVLCPVLISLTLICGSLFILKKGYQWMNWINIVFASAGIILLIWSVLAIPVSLLQSYDPDIFYTFIPKHFPWHFYIPGLILLALGFFFKLKSRSIIQIED
jgi:hypothetical protein